MSTSRHGGGVGDLRWPVTPKIAGSSPAGGTTTDHQIVSLKKALGYLVHVQRKLSQARADALLPEVVRLKEAIIVEINAQGGTWEDKSR